MIKRYLYGEILNQNNNRRENHKKQTRDNYV